MNGLLGSDAMRGCTLVVVVRVRDLLPYRVTPQPMRSNRGFTLVELMIGLVLVALLMGIGLPTFREFILNQQLRATTSDLRIALTLARSEAVKRNRVIELRQFDGTDWGSGWIIPSPIVGDPDLLTHQQSGDVVISADPDVALVQFTPMGRATTEVQFEVDIGPPGSSIQGCMLLELDGRVTSTTGACL